VGGRDFSLHITIGTKVGGQVDLRACLNMMVIAAPGRN
jgi:hypothetical protein